MFERLTGPAKRSIVRAEQEAIGFGLDYIGTQHLLLGLLAGGDGRAVLTLRALGADPAGLRAALLARPATA